MAEATWNYVAEGLEQTGKLLAAAIGAVVGTPVKVAPLDDEVSARFGVWLRGERAELDAVREVLEADLDKRKLTRNGMEWQQPMESGK
jgi:NADPH-dependent ferric siderophore reductase